jgi:hypothetical protein
MRTIIPHLAVARDHFAFVEGLESDSVTSTAYLLEQLPYCLSSCFEALSALINDTRSVCDRIAGNASAGISYPLADVDHYPLAFKIDAFLESGVRAQNAIMPYLRRAYHGQSLPKSFRDLATRFAKGAHVLDIEVRQEILAYWRGHGERLRDYRDVSQHYALVASETVIFRSDSNDLGMYLVLPNNPEARGVSKLSYSPPVHALPYLIDEFVKLVAIAFRVTDLILPPDVDRTRVAMLTAPRNPNVLGELGGHSVPLADTLERELAACLDRQNKWRAARRDKSTS